MKRIIILIVLLALAAAGYYWWVEGRPGLPPQLDPFIAPTASNAVTGSGSIEAERVAVSAEFGGRILAIHASEGDEVHKGDLLVELDGSVLLAQRNQLEAAVTEARANLARVSAPPLPEAIAAAQAELDQAQAAAEAASSVAATAQQVAANPLEISAKLDSAKSQVEMLSKQVEAAQAALKTAEVQSDEASRNQAGDEAKTRYQASIKDVEAARANLAAVQAELEGAQQQVELLSAIRDNPLALKAQADSAASAYAVAQAGVEVAKAKLAAVQAGPRPEDVAIARAQLAQAEAALARMDVQISKLRLLAPRDGIVTERVADPGELAAPGATLLTLANLDQVTLTVYVPDMQMGRVHLGQEADVSVDAYPGETFKGTVTYIAAQAEFTPKNVQTKEERANLVFAVKITLANADHRLKPGMPADATLR
jgi:HlyD family secretion protein